MIKYLVLIRGVYQAWRLGHIFLQYADLSWISGIIIEEDILSSGGFYVFK